MATIMYYSMALESSTSKAKAAKTERVADLYEIPIDNKKVNTFISSLQSLVGNTFSIVLSTRC